MNPLLAQLAEEAIQRFSQTDTGRKLMTKGKQIIEIAKPMSRKASQIAVSLLDEGDERPQVGKHVQLNKDLDIVKNGLSLPLSFRENQFKVISQKITDDLDIIKGQNEILFLSNSINYFVDSHRLRTGIDRGISYALQYDMIAVTNHLKRNKDLRFPGYLLHQLTSLAETIKELNIFYVSVLQDGVVPEYHEEEVKAELMRTFGVEGRKSDFLSYIPYDLQVKARQELPPVEQSKEKNASLLGSLKEKVLTKDLEGLNVFAHDSLIILKEELMANEILEIQLLKKLETTPEGSLRIEG
ncbi:hypothetical protein ACJO2E_10980 [Marinobacter sp. M1N3S26]|uniref:hypothetical protein n=1 Tax=Marinobacter sp. M1N3S26 TaxID=3382299 RepID=UPI00387B7050